MEYTKNRLNVTNNLQLVKEISSESLHCILLKKKQKEIWKLPNDKATWIG
ncbi:hypothetical protein [Dyadobacter arcticus]|uniref:Uncharacterized protein n=1 Tax=Dyadobacter arcticus TaxID=1078754 RepID=A0ABX0UN83_9BACT|nr:hypothetical protein [Dyadobacter arcticus]NIJ54451.1 hypothetical protein [Dyadobacter arcticus]